MAAKLRLDSLLVQKGLIASRERAKTTVMSGNVYVDGQKAEKPGQEYDVNAHIEVRQDPIGFVSRGGLKLEKALEEFEVDVAGLLAIDCGASTGGFTDCLLRRGAAHVWAIDVGYGQLDWALRNDERVTCMERTNIRNVLPEQIGEAADLAVLDLSFISLKLVLPVVKRLLKQGGRAICLVKPQFEAGRGQVGKNGVVREKRVHCEVLRRFCEYSPEAGFAVEAATYSPVKGPKGNIEFLALLSAEEKHRTSLDIDGLVGDAHNTLREGASDG